MRPSPSQLLSVAKTQAFLVTDLTNIRYLTGCCVSAGLLLVTDRQARFFVDARYRYEVEKSCRRGIAVRDAADVPEALAAIPRCGFEADSVTVARSLSWKKKFPGTTFQKTIGVVEQFRRQKDEEEIRLMQRAQRLTKELLRRIPSSLRAGTTEAELARRLTIWALELGADGMAFDPIVAFGTNSSVPHHVPGSRALKKGHIVQIDVGVRYRGYCSDLSRVFFTAPPTPLQKGVFETLRSVQSAVIAQAKAGVSNHRLDILARKILAEKGMEQAFTHALGHGLGLDVHEGITLSQRGKEQKLLRGEVVTVEPGVYFPGKFGMRLEDEVFVV